MSKELRLEEVEILKLENIELKLGTLKNQAAMLQDQKAKLAEAIEARLGVKLSDYQINGADGVLKKIH